MSKNFSNIQKAFAGSCAVNVLRVASAAAKTETVVIGADVFEVNVGLGVTAGRLAIDVSANGTKSTGTLTQTANPGNGETVVLGSVTYTFKTTLTGAANEILIGATCAASMTNLISAVMGTAGSGSTYGTGTVANSLVNAAEGSDVAATGTLTSDNTAPSDGDTVTIGTKVYTFKTALTPTEGQVLINSTADAALLNLIRAINHTGTPGTDYQCAAANAFVSAAASVTSHAFAVTALTAGGAGNLIASTETSAHLSWGAATLTGGSDKVTVTAVETGTGGDSLATTETLANGSFGGATLSGGVQPTAGNFVDAALIAIGRLNTQRLGAVKIGTNELLVFTLEASNRTLACTETLAGSNNAWAAAAMYGGQNAAAKKFEIATRTPNAQEVTLGNLHFYLPFTAANVLVHVVDSTGKAVAWDGVWTVTGRRVTLDNSGSTDWSATTPVTVFASE